jgi:ATPases involved in chromosome partitioning
LENKRISPIASLNKAVAQSSASQIAKMSEVRHFTAAEFDAMKIVHAGDEGSVHLKVFRDLRTQLMKQTDWRNFVCLVTSAAPGGSSHVAVNLAATISLDKSKTSLLVDANLYSPYAETLLPVPSQLGLTDYLDDPTTGVEDIVYASGVPRMRVVPVGNNREGGTEKLNSPRMRDFFAEIKARYADRYIIVDAPSAADYDAEIRILAELCDFVVLVVPYGKVTESQLNASIEKIGRDRLAGIVYNWC